jgi:hypothetical protein
VKEEGRRRREYLLETCGGKAVDTEHEGGSACKGSGNEEDMVVDLDGEMMRLVVEKKEKRRGDTFGIVDRAKPRTPQPVKREG